MTGKKILFTLLCFTAIVSLFGQDSFLTLSFTARYYNNHVPIDSILVENLTQSVDTVLYYPDTVLLLDLKTGVTPDPGHCPGKFELLALDQWNESGGFYFMVCMPGEEEISLSVVDIKGRRITGCKQFLRQGNHEFVFFPGNSRMNILNAEGKSGRRTLKISGSHWLSDPDCSIRYNGIRDHGKGLKSGFPANNMFRFAMGDSLRYTVYAKTTESVPGSDVKWEVPYNSAVYQFSILPGYPCSGVPAVLYEGKVYKTVDIFDQCWFKENLNVGIMIPGIQEMANNGVIEKYCYADSEDSCNIYGGLYQWNEMMQYVTTQGVQGICPPGWHLPTDSEWSILTDKLGGVATCSVALKESGTDHWWFSHSAAGTNVSGFTAFGGGSRLPDGTFADLREYGRFYASTEVTIYSPAGRMLLYNTFTVYTSFFGGKDGGFSVRCLKD